MKNSIKHLQLEPGKVLLDGEEFPYMLTKVEVMTGPDQINMLHLEVPFQWLTGSLVKQSGTYRFESDDPDELYEFYRREVGKERSKAPVGHSDDEEPCQWCGEVHEQDDDFTPGGSS